MRRRVPEETVDLHKLKSYNGPTTRKRLGRSGRKDIEGVLIHSRLRILFSEQGSKSSMRQEEGFRTNFP